MNLPSSSLSSDNELAINSQSLINKNKRISSAYLINQLPLITSPCKINYLFDSIKLSNSNKFFNPSSLIKYNGDCSLTAEFSVVVRKTRVQLPPFAYIILRSNIINEESNARAGSTLFKNLWFLNQSEILLEFLNLLSLLK